MTRRVAGPGAALLALFFWCTDTQGIFPCFAAAAIVHELGHLAAMAALGAQVQGLRICGAGLEIRYACTLSHARDALVAFAGPAVNLLVSALCSYLTVAGLFPEETYLFSGAGIALGLFNLLPAAPLDGAGILYGLVCFHTDPVCAQRTVDATTLACGIGMCALGLYILLKTRYNISMLASGSLIIGGFYAKRAGESPAKGAKTRALCWRRVRTDQKRP